MWCFRTPGRLVAVSIAFLAVAASGLTGCTREISPGSPGKSNATLSVDPGAVLLDANTVDDVMGISGSKVLDEGNAPDDTADVSPSECHGLVYIAGEIEYAPTDYTSLRWRIVGAGKASRVVEMVAQLPSVAKADEFIDKQTKDWEACAGQVITTKDKASGQTIQEDRVTAVRTRPDTVISTLDSVPVSGEPPCLHGQHVLQAVSNVVLDVSTCGGSASDPAEAIASKLADRL